MEKIRNIIFDLGGVFLTIDYNKTEEAFTNLGVKNFHSLYSQHKASGLFKLLETGNISPEDFCAEVRLQADFSASDEEIKNAWCAMLGSFPKEYFPWLEEISKRYNVFLFSNTNAIHYDIFQQKFQNEIGGKPFNDYFIKTYYSHTLHLRKPDEQAYSKVLELENLAANETLFIDDTLVNIEGAAKVNLQTIFLEKPKTVLHLDI